MWSILSVSLGKYEIIILLIWSSSHTDAHKTSVSTEMVFTIKMARIHASIHASIYNLDRQQRRVVGGLSFESVGPGFQDFLLWALYGLSSR